MKINGTYGLALGCVMGIFLMEAAYVKRQLKAPTDTQSPVTYFADDESYSVTLSPEDVQFIGSVLKPHITFDKDYNKPINKGFIRRLVRTCQCGEKAVLLKKVLTDFEGKIVEVLYTKLGLRREL